jgi:hypothetical protein
MKKRYLLFILLSLALASCTTDKGPDTKNIIVDLKPVRFDQLFFEIDTQNVSKGLQDLKNKHPYFMDVFTRHLAGYGPINDTSIGVVNALKHMLTYKDYVNLNKTVQTKFPNTTQQDKELTQLIKNIKYYWRDYKIPKLYYFISGLNNYNAITYDTIIGIGLDMYLGKDFEFYPAVQLPQYEIDRCEPKYIPINSAHNIYESRYPFEPNDKDLLTLMLEKGRAFYFMDKVLPEIDLATKLGYTKEQLAWAEKNEGMVWNYFIQQNLLYSKQMTRIMPMVIDGPNTPNLPAESPGNIGTYIGWQIVKRYADDNKLSVEQVCKLTENAQIILQKSKYKPR